MRKIKRPQETPPREEREGKDAVFLEDLQEGPAERKSEKKEREKKERKAARKRQHQARWEKWRKIRNRLPGAGMLASLKRLGRYVLAVLLCYLVQVAVMPYVRIANVTPNLLYCMIAVVTVTSGRLRAYWTGAVYGILMETMLPTLSYLNLLLYPITAVFCSIFFADKSDKRLEAERAMNRPARNGNVYVRTVACAGMNMLLYEVVNLAYIYLGGTDLTSAHITRGLMACLLTMALAALVMVPLRLLLGFRHPPKEEKEATGRYLRKRNEPGN